MNIFAKVVLSSSIIFSSLAYAAIPPLSEENRVQMADVIVEGTVEKVVKKKKAVSAGTDIVATATVQLSRVEKGTVKQGDSLSVTYWYVHKREGGWCGPQGQNNPREIKQGAQLRFYLHQQDDGSFSLLEPNGTGELAND